MELLFTVRMCFSDDVDPVDAKAVLESTLEHCRQESMLSDPHEETSCDFVEVTSVVVQP